MEINQLKTVKVNAKVLKLHLKVCDEFTATLLDSDGQTLKEYDGYVPSLMPEQHFGDYVYLDIDIDTGQILNWKTPSAEEVEAFVRNGEDD